jgi:hypothetical protein
MRNAHSRDSSRTEHAALVERVLLLRGALEGLTDDNAELHRRLSRVRAENTALRARLQTSGGPAVKELAAR